MDGIHFKRVLTFSGFTRLELVVHIVKISILPDTKQKTIIASNIDKVFREENNIDKASYNTPSPRAQTLIATEQSTITSNCVVHSGETVNEMLWVWVSSLPESTMSIGC